MFHALAFGQVSDEDSFPTLRTRTKHFTCRSCIIHAPENYRIVGNIRKQFVWRTIFAVTSLAVSPISSNNLMSSFEVRDA